MEIDMMESIAKANHMERASTSGRMEIATRVNFKKARDQVTEY